MRLRKHRCPNCNAPLAEGTSSCTYCDVGAAGVHGTASSKDASRRFSFRSSVKIGLGLLSLLCCAPLSVFITLSETVYSVEMEAPKYSAQPPAVDQRSAEPLTAMQVFMEVRDTDDRSLAQRKQAWREKLEGRWVSWKGRVEDVRPYDAFASELVLRPEADQEFKVRVYFDPLHNGRLKQLQVGQEAQVSGKLWGYEFIGNTVNLAEGALVQESAPSQVQEQPL